VNYAARNAARVTTVWAVLASLALAQDQPFIVKPTLPIPVRSYVAPTVPAVRLTNTSRLYSLIRAGNLYLTLQDALALAIENNLNLEIDRYTPLLADAGLERARAGGPYRGVPSGSAQISSVNSGVGVNGSALSAGVGGSGGGGGGGGGGGATIQQVGQQTPNLDAVLQSTVNFSHLTQPQVNTVLSQTTSLVQSVRTYNSVVQQGLLTGGVIQFRDYENYLSENAPSDALNPAVGPHMDFSIQQPLLQGFGVSLNNRDIRRASIGVVSAREQFRAQLLGLVASVANLYWDLVGAREELTKRRRALEITQKFRDDTKYEISVGAIAGVELPRAEAEFANRRQDLVLAEANVQNRGILLKEALSHTEDPLLESAEIIPLDRIEVPENEDLTPLRQMVTTAMAKRPDVAVSNYTDQMAEINLAGTTNPLLPSLRVNALSYNRGAAGQPNGPGVDSYFVGGYGTALGQVFRRNFPNNQVQLSFSAPIGNRLAQADYGIDQLQFQQNKLTSQRDTNKIIVDVSAQASALRQARARYNTAKNTRVLQEELLSAEMKRSTGVTTFNVIMADQRALSAAQLSEVSALTAYAHASIALDQVLGVTLERYHITLDEGLNGKVNRESKLPEILGTQN